MISKKRVALLASTLSLALYAITGAAQPNNDHPGNKGKADRGDGYPSKSQQTYRHHEPAVDLGAVRITLRNHRDLLAPAASLPPGIQKNLARGKPLPPGIAKKMDSRLLGRLPRYDGYEWKQIGRDVILVAIATGIVYEILENILD
ncbi:RcnB family protein [Pseudomonas stutzeri]|uniref:Integral membrane protein n=1 Tax=Stutzerimonas stutzeri TaxID=316 RepID=A0A2N8S6Y4_STUST|nr:anti-virulence regulator CigR family protein [Stutzerimonas stutzeri]MCQ4294691.1 RcnB family protein [Stutzerimonas stutzeri]PNF82385.1 hypothetical protein CXK92_02695 [Stutzerimonas stutzeri]